MLVRWRFGRQEFFGRLIIAYTSAVSIIDRMRNESYERINITLPSHTLRRVDHVAKHGDRSRFIDTAINFYLTQRSRARLRKSLREGAANRATRDRDIAAMLDFSDAWENHAA